VIERRRTDAKETDMKAFVMSIVALVLITAVAAIGLGSIETSSTDRYQERSNVRL
jgi:hypothetical protein